MHDAFYGDDKTPWPPHAFGVVNKEVSWLKRLWFLVSNPFTYVFMGKIRW